MRREGPDQPAEAGDSIRERLAALLRAEPLTARELSARASVSEKDVVSHLPHVLRSAQARGERVTIEPARCVACGFAFDERSRTGKPGRCPRCRAERIAPARFHLGG